MIWCKEVVRISPELRNTYQDDGIQVCWAWCCKNFGPPSPSGQYWTWDAKQTFFFVEAADANWFKLRWL